MNDEIKKLLMQAKVETQEIRDNRELEERRKKLEREEFLSKASRNADLINLKIFMELITEYHKSPFKEANDYYSASLPFLFADCVGPINGKTYSEKDLELARHYNKLHSNPDDQIVFFINNDELIPVNLYVLCTTYQHKCVYSLIKADFNVQKFENLLFEALDGKLDKLFNQQLVDLLKEAGAEAKKLKNEAGRLLDIAKRNANLICLNIYKKLIEEYKKNPNVSRDLFYRISIGALYPGQLDEKDYQNVESVQKYNCLQTNFLDRIDYYCYENDGESTYIPTTYRLLSSQLENDDISFNISDIEKGKCKVSINSKCFENLMIKVAGNEEKKEFSKTTSRINHN